MIMWSLNQFIIVLFACSYWWLLSNSDLTSEKHQDGYDDGVSILSPPPPPVACSNCNGCPNPCTPQPLQPPPPPPRKGSVIYAAPPPPSGGANCPPVAPVTCCQYTPPNPYGPTNPMPNNGYPYDFGNYTQSFSFSTTPCLVMMLVVPFVYVFGV
ncbi:hypothetical protein QVD17_05582 [Tagetes erecta]|uniref:Uncharacterized protein n=1 Tax=Tagetes erecta TaxID=13708 RepID=A0AAD8LE42_TARER|nr:hypothetical protein QVD17_05582 [Tagetes erecta]